MRSLYLLLSPALSLAPVAATRSRDEPNISQPGIIHLPIKAINTSDPDTPALPSDIGKRQSGVNVERLSIRHVIEVFIGTPPQAIMVEPDLGSDALWVPNTIAEVFHKGGPYDYNVFFDITQSSTAKYLNKSGNIRYSLESVDYELYEDEMSFSSSLPLGRVEIGIADRAPPNPWGVLGFTLTGSGADLLDRLQTQGSIQSKLLSFNYVTGGGHITFGGVDVKKFSGPLQTVHIPPTSKDRDANFQTNNINSFYMHRVNVTGISITADNGDVIHAKGFQHGQEYIIDSGAATLRVPDAVVEALVNGLPVAPNEYDMVECSAIEASKGSMDFSFGTTTIKVPFKDLFRKENQKCRLIVKGSTTLYLGANFMRSAYVAIDFTKHEAYLAQNADCGSEVIPISNGISSIVGKCPLNR